MTEPDAPARLLFVLGFPRSGTTLLGQILATRPRVALLEERPLLAKAVAHFYDPPDGPARLAAASEAELDGYRADFWARVAAHGIALPQGRLVVEQTAFNTVYLPLILRLFPAAPIVFALRDPRDVVFGCFRRRFAPNRFTLEFSTLEGAAQLYCDTMQLTETCRQKLGFRPLEIRNEDLIADFDHESQRLCAFAGLDWNDAVRDFHQSGHTLTTVSGPQIRRGLSDAGVGQWRRYAQEMAPVLPMLRPWVDRFGYPFG